MSNFTRFVVAIIVCVAIMLSGMYITKAIVESDMPAWAKVWLLK